LLWLGGGGNANRNPPAEFFGLWGASASTSTSIAVVAPLSGTLCDVRLSLSGTPGAGDGFTFTLHSGANTLACSVNAVGAATCPGTLTVTAGDLVYLQETNTGPTAPGNSTDFQWGATFTAQ
jgi:hypothetical protein